MSGRTFRDTPWGTDGVVSMPQPMPTTETDTIDMEGFVFTPDGLKINVSRAEREDIIASAFRPESGQ